MAVFTGVEKTFFTFNDWNGNKLEEKELPTIFTKLDFPNYFETFELFSDFRTQINEIIQRVDSIHENYLNIFPNIKRES